MKKLTGLNEPVLGLDGQPLLELDGVTKVIPKNLLSNVIARGQSEEPAKAMAVALKIYSSKGELELEDAEFTLALESVQKDQVLNNLAKSAILKVLE